MLHSLLTEGMSSCCLLMCLQKLLSPAWPQDGSRYLQRLPARMRTDDAAGMDAVVTPVWLLGQSTWRCPDLYRELIKQSQECRASVNSVLVDLPIVAYVLASRGSFLSPFPEAKGLRSLGWPDDVTSYVLILLQRGQGRRRAPCHRGLSLGSNQDQQSGVQKSA